jgi:hypothetical protein
VPKIAKTTGGMMMLLGFSWFLCAIACALLANKRNRSPLGWFLISMILSPLLGFIFLLVIKDLSITPDQLAPSDATHVRCQACAEFVLPQAAVCKHCGAALPTDANMQKVRERQQACYEADAQAHKIFGWILAAAVLVVLLIAIK